MGQLRGQVVRTAALRRAGAGVTERLAAVGVAVRAVASEILVVGDDMAVVGADELSPLTWVAPAFFSRDMIGA